MIDYEENARVLKVLADANRLKIIDILSCGERCACDILEHFEFTQPTLSHHMKVLMDAELVHMRKDGIWNHYSLNMENCNKSIINLMNIFSNTEDCICNEIGGSCCK